MVCMQCKLVVQLDVFLGFTTPGWNDPPNVKSTGNLKINLNKRVAFPLSTSSSSQPTAAPLLLPPKPPTTNIPDPASSEPSESVLIDDDLNLKKEKVLSVLNNAVESLNPSIQSSVAPKMKTLEDDWPKSDSELKKLLVELSECKTF